MLNFFAATGHINYARKARLHLQNNLELEINYPWVYTNFIEHEYQFVKSRGGLTTGRGVTESVRHGCEACTVVQIFTMVCAI